MRVSNDLCIVFVVAMLLTYLLKIFLLFVLETLGNNKNVQKILIKCKNVCVFCFLQKHRHFAVAHVLLACHRHVAQPIVSTDRPTDIARGRSFVAYASVQTTLPVHTTYAKWLSKRTAKLNNSPAVLSIESALSCSIFCIDFANF